MISRGAMSAHEMAPSQEPGFDHTLAECATSAAKALSQPGGWTQLHGRARVCYQRLLTLVSFMHMADGHNSARVWHFVSDYVARVQQQEKEDAERASPQNSELFALSAVGVSVAGSTGAAASVAMPVVSSLLSRDSQSSGNPYAWAAAAMEAGQVASEPPSKKCRHESGTAPPQSPRASHSGSTFAMPFGAISPPHQVLMNMGADPKGKQGSAQEIPEPKGPPMAPGSLSFAQ